jgi:hypothetical protein
VCAPHRLSVLVVEDSPDAADSLADLLRLCGHPVTVARTTGAGQPAALSGSGMVHFAGEALHRWQRAFRRLATVDVRQFTAVPELGPPSPERTAGRGGAGPVQWVDDTGERLAPRADGTYRDTGGGLWVPASLAG